MESNTGISYSEAAAFFAERDGFVVFAHAHPDGDTLGSAAALVRVLRSAGKRALAVCADRIPEKLRFLAKDGVFSDALPEQVETAVSVDVASMATLGGFASFADKRGFDLAIDHHKISTLPCRLALRRPDYISNGEIIYELIKCSGFALDAAVAEALYTAICSDSGGFRYQNTRPETYEYAADLIRHGADFTEINKVLFERKSASQFRLEREAYGVLELHHGGRLAIVAIDRDFIRRTGVSDLDFEPVYRIPRCLEGVEVSAVLRPDGDGTKVSLRSNDYYDVSAFAKRCGGGGHLHAAGYLYDGSVKEAAEALIRDMEGSF